MNRLVGLDVARFLALAGMVLVNFNVVMTDQTSQLTDPLLNMLQGKAAALFVILAGVGLGLGARKLTWSQAMVVNGKRVVLLMIIGLLNVLVFQPDIIHYYAVYFLLGACVLPLNNQQLSALMACLVLLSVLLIITLNYDQGWDWQTLHYTDFWSINGFVRNLLFNGWHPVLPWVCFLLLGIQLSRLNLSARKTQTQMLMVGLLVWLISAFTSQTLQRITEDTEWSVLLTTSPIPPMPFYLVSAAGLATALIGGCLLLTAFPMGQRLWSVITPLGRQTLTWYILHIYLGMGVIEATLGLGNSDTTTAVWMAMAFLLLATVVARIWVIWFKAGPLELLMKRLIGRGKVEKQGTTTADR
jgi:uncharacterized protein